MVCWVFYLMQCYVFNVFFLVFFNVVEIVNVSYYEELVWVKVFCVDIFMMNGNKESYFMKVKFKNL